jgi:hypothetical protein
LPESLILEHLYYQIRTYFERNLLTAAPAARQELRRKFRRAGKNSFLPTTFLFARPSENYQNSASGFSLKKVRIFFRADSLNQVWRFSYKL